MPKKEDWKKIGEPRVLASRYGKSLSAQRYINPGTGKKEDYILFGQKDWFVTLVLTEDNQVVTVSEFKQGRDGWGLELPADTFKGNGPPDVSTVRENILHETGYNGNITSLGFTWLATRGSPTRIWHFAMRNAKKIQEAKLDKTEDIICQTMKLQDWLDAIANGKITEHSAIVATMLSGVR